LDDRPTNLPRRLSSFVGREQQIAQGRKLFESSPLVTLTGPGGVGKTTLAMQIAAGMLDELPDGVWLAELGNVSEEGMVLGTVAAALRVTEQPAATSPRPSSTACATAVWPWSWTTANRSSRHAPTLPIPHHATTDVRILATSRERLESSKASASCPCRRSSCQTPAPRSSVDEAGRYPAIKLFVERATAAQPGFRLTEQNVGAVGPDLPAPRWHAARPGTGRRRACVPCLSSSWPLASTTASGC
jgi:non-specific serine/threonine protein kinase